MRVSRTIYSWPRLAWNGRSFALTYSHKSLEGLLKGVRLQELDAAGHLLGDPLELTRAAPSSWSDTCLTTCGAVVAPSEDGFFAAWNEGTFDGLGLPVQGALVQCTEE